MAHDKDANCGEKFAWDFFEGKKHDFRLFKESKLPFQKAQNLLVDTGYTRILKQHLNSDIPKKSTKKRSLTSADKSRNKEISSSRIIVENVYRRFKEIQNNLRMLSQPPKKILPPLKLNLRNL